MKHFVVVITLLAVVSSGLSFECRKIGLHADKRARDCDAYFVCGSNETAQRFTCPEGTRFSQRKLKCVAAENIVCNLQDLASDVECQTEGAQGEVDQSAGCWDTVVCRETRNGSLAGFTGLCRNCSCVLPDVDEDYQPDAFVCPDVGRFPDPQSEDCAAYYLCVKGVDDSLVKSKVSCAAGTVFSPAQKKCVLETGYNCPNDSSASTESTPELTTTQEEPDNTFQCSTVGRFPDAESLDCRDYVICSKNADGAFVQSKATCPLRTVFNSNTARCVLADSYSCPSAISTSTSTSSTKPSPPLNDCSGVGRFSDQTSTDCKKYLICSENANGSLVQSSATCPSRTVFNPESLRCVLDTTYSCPTAPASTPPSITQPNSLFVCQEPGRFDDVESTDCKKYVICSKNAEGLFLSSSATCPRDTIFNAATRRCVLATSYVCPRLTVTTTTTPRPFSCPDVGRYPDSDALDCRTYILCTRNGAGELLPNTRHCPPNNVFDGTTKRCVAAAKYTCPRG